jgi:hypothetical protein
MATTITSQTVDVKSAPIAGMGFFQVFDIAFGVYPGDDGEPVDLSSYFTTVIGGWPIGTTTNDGGFVNKYIYASGNSAADGAIESFYVGLTQVALTECPTSTALSAMTAERWMFVGT